MRFRILGPLEVSDQDGLLDLGAVKQCSLLADAWLTGRRGAGVRAEPRTGVGG